MIFDDSNMVFDSRKQGKQVGHKRKLVIEEGHKRLKTENLRNKEMTICFEGNELDTYRKLKEWPQTLKIKG